MKKIIFVVIDACRSSNLGCYGYYKPTSPNIDKIAEKGVLFRKAFSCTNATDPSLTSIFSGKYPASHGIIHHGESVTKTSISNIKHETFLQEVLRERGYVTLGIDWLGRWHKKGFDYYSGKIGGNTWIWRIRRRSHPIVNAVSINLRNYTKKLPRIHSTLGSIKCGIFGDWTLPDNAKCITDHALNLINKKLDKDFFLFIHYWDTHAPYFSPKEYVYRFYDSDVAIARYDGAIAYVDEQIGRIIEKLEKEDILDESIIIITSDHGESLKEHGIYFDHHGLYDVTIQVPLIIKCKNFPSKKVDGLIQHIDLFLTILDILGIEDVNLDLDGTSLFPLIYHGTRIRDCIIAEEAYAQRRRCIRTEKYKYIYSLSEELVCRRCKVIHGSKHELYDLENDPLEEKNIAEKEKEIAAKLHYQLIETIKKLNTKREKAKIKRKIMNMRYLNG